jgi:hypothetical protein
MGIPDDAACPECGAPAPPQGWLVVFGGSTEVNSPVPFWLLGSALSLTAFVLVIVSFTTRIPVPGPAIFGLLFGGVFAIGRAWTSRSGPTDGGDVVWILKPDELEMRFSLFHRHWPWHSIDRALYARGWRRGSVQLSVFQPSVGQAPELSMWLNERDVDTRALHQTLRDRIERARVAKSSPAPTP